MIALLRCNYNIYKKKHIYIIYTIYIIFIEVHCSYTIQFTSLLNVVYVNILCTILDAKFKMH